LGEHYPQLAEQRCWNHRLTNVLDAMPKKHQAEARTLLCAMPYAETQAACEALRTQFATRYHKLTPKAVELLASDWERLVLPLCSGALAALADHKYRGVTLRHGTATHHGRQTLQESRERHHSDLVDLTGG